MFMRFQSMLMLMTLAGAVIHCASGQQPSVVAVPAAANIFAAGQSSAFSGDLPPFVTFTAGSIEAVTMTAKGKVTLDGGLAYSGPGGIPFPGGTGLTSFDGLSGIIARNSGFFLTGVFLDDSVPSGNGPPVLNFTNAENFLVLKPQLFQTFYVGAGLTGTVHKLFFVPAGATRLFLGIADGCVLAGGPPGCYQDNLGTFGVTVTLHPVTPPPASTPPGKLQAVAALVRSTRPLLQVQPVSSLG